jgi:purine-binding chemotaxis protein CheW
MAERAVDFQEVIIELGDAEYGIPASAVKEIVRLVEITPIPESSESVKGAIDYRGTIAVVVDLALRLGLKPAPYDLNTQIIIVESEAGLTGLVVERVADVITINPEAVMRGRASELQDEISTGAYEDGERLVILLDITRILRVKKRKESKK